MYSYNPFAAANQFEKKYGNEAAVYVANITTSGRHFKEDRVFLMFGPKHNDGNNKVRIDVLFQALSDEAIKGTGQYYELYESNLTRLLVDYAGRLHLLDRQIFIEYVNSKGFNISEPNYRSDVLEQVDLVMSDIRQSEI